MIEEGFWDEEEDFTGEKEEDPENNDRKQIEKQNKSESESESESESKSESNKDTRVLDHESSSSCCHRRCRRPSVASQQQPHWWRRQRRLDPTTSTLLGQPQQETTHQEAQQQHFTLLRRKGEKGDKYNSEEEGNELDEEHRELRQVLRYLVVPHAQRFLESWELGYSHCHVATASEEACPFIAWSRPERQVGVDHLFNRNRAMNRAMGCCTLTDGTFCWPEGYYHYILFHDVRPSKAFVKHIQEQEAKQRRQQQQQRREEEKITMKMKMQEEKKQLPKYIHLNMQEQEMWRDPEKVKGNGVAFDDAPASMEDVASSKSKPNSKLNEEMELQMWSYESNQPVAIPGPTLDFLRRHTTLFDIPTEQALDEYLVKVQRELQMHERRGTKTANPSQIQCILL